MATAHLKWEASTADAIAHIEALKAAIDGVDNTSTRTSRTGGGLSRLTSAWKIMVPAVAAAGVAILAFTGNMAVLAPLIPVMTVALAGLLAPFTTLAAIVVGFIPPVTLLVGLLGGLAVAFGFGAKAALTSKTGFDRFQEAIKHLEGRFAGLSRTLGHIFMPVFMFFIRSASQALNYLDKIVKLPLKQAFDSLSTTGVAGLQKFFDHIGDFLRKPLRLAFKVAFGKDATLRKALVDDWNDIWSFLTKGQNSPGHFIAKWFGKQDFTATGMRWANELAGATLSALGAAFMKAMSSQGGRFILGGAAGGAAIGAALGGPIGAAMGLAIGVAIGVVLNHYWPKIKADARRAFHAVGAFLKSAIGAPTWNAIIHNAERFWGTLKSIGGFIRNDIYPIVRKVWDKLGGWGAVIEGTKRFIQGIARAFDDVLSAVNTFISGLETAWSLLRDIFGFGGSGTTPHGFTPGSQSGKGNPYAHHQTSRSNAVSPRMSGSANVVLPGVTLTLSHAAATNLARHQARSTARRG